MPEDAERVKAAEAIHGETYIQARDYVTLDLKRFQAEESLLQIIGDSAFTHHAQDRAIVALEILTNDKFLDPEYRRRVRAITEGE